MKYSKQNIKRRNITQSNLNVDLLPDSIWGVHSGALSQMSVREG